VVAFSLSLAYREAMRLLCSTHYLGLRGVIMAYKPWYERVAEINDQHEREQFIRGVFGFRPKEKPIITGLIAGYVGGKVAAKKAKKK